MIYKYRLHRKCFQCLTKFSICFITQQQCNVTDIKGGCFRVTATHVQSKNSWIISSPEPDPVFTNSTQSITSCNPYQPIFLIPEGINPIWTSIGSIQIPSVTENPVKNLENVFYCTLKNTTAQQREKVVQESCYCTEISLTPEFPQQTLRWELGGSGVCRRPLTRLSHGCCTVC